MAITYSSGIITVTGGKDSGTATSGTSTRIYDTSQSWSTNVYAGRFVWIHSGTGAGQRRRITGGGSTYLNINFAWDTTPDSTSQYLVTYDFADIKTANNSGGWGVVTLTGGTQYNINAVVRYGDDSNYTAFGDCQKQVQFSTYKTPGAGFSSRYGYSNSVRSKAMVIFGEHVGDKVSQKGCVLYYNMTHSFIEFLVARPTGNIDFHSSSISGTLQGYFGGALLSSGGFIAAYNSLINCDVGIYPASASYLTIGDIFQTIHSTDNLTNSIGLRANGEIFGAKVYNSDLSFTGNSTVSGVDATYRNITIRNVNAIYRADGNASNNNCYMIDIDSDTWTMRYDDGGKWTGTLYRQWSVNYSMIGGVTGFRFALFNNAGTEVFNTTNTASDLDEQIVSEGYLKRSNGQTFTTYNSQDFKIRKYGYEFVSRVLVVANAITEGITPTVNDFVVASEATAWAYTGFTIVGDTSIAMSSAHTLQELYDYSQAWAVQSGNIQYIEPITTTNKIIFTGDSSYDLTLSQVLTATGQTYATEADVTLSGSGAFDCTMEMTGGTLTTPVFANVDGDVNLIGGEWILSDVGTAVGGTADATSKIVVNTASTDDEFDFQAFTFTSGADFENTSGNDIILVLSAGQTIPDLIETSGSITVQQPTIDAGITFTGLIATSQVIVFETGTQTVITSIESSSTTFEWSELYTGDQTVDYTIINEGYYPIRVTGVLIEDTVQTVAVQQVTDRAYATSSGLTFGSTATVNTTTERFTVTTNTTVQNWYSFMMESWRDQSTLKNKAFPLLTNGPASFTLSDGWEWYNSNSITYLSQDGFRYTDGGTITAVWSAIQVIGDTGSLDIRFQQEDGGTTETSTDADGVLQVYGDSSHGNFDYTDHLVIKAQGDGYDQDESDVYDTYGTLEDQFYIVALNPTENGLATGNPSVTGVTITDHGTSPVTWNGEDFSITITDSATPHSGTEIMRWLRYSYGVGGTFQSKDTFDWHDLVQTNGTKFKTVNGAIYGDTGATLKGVRVVQNDGTTPHPSFNLFTADDGSTYEPPTVITIGNTNLADGTRVRLYNVTQSTELDNSLVSGGSGYSYNATVGTGEEVVVGDTIKMTSAYNSTTTYYNETEESAVASTSDMTMLAEQSNNTVLNGYGLDGSAQTDFAADYPNVEVDINSGDTTREKLLCWLAYIITTEDGIRDFFGAITHQDSGNAIINTSVVDLLLDYTGTGNSQFTDTIWLKRDDDSTIFGGNGDNFYANSDKVYTSVVNTTGTPVITGDIADLNDVTADEVADEVMTRDVATETNATSNKGEVIKNVKKFS